MIAPDKVTTPAYAEHCYDEYKTGTIFMTVGGIGCLAASLAVESHPESGFLGMAGGVSLAIAYNSGKKTMAYYRRLNDLMEGDY